MFNELREKEIFELAQKYAYQYQETIGERNVYPTAEALDNLKNFEEDLPNLSSAAKEVIELLEEYGAPATVVQQLRIALQTVLRSGFAGTFPFVR